MLPVSTKDTATFSPLTDTLANLKRLLDQAESDEARGVFEKAVAEIEQKLAEEPDQPSFRLAIPSHFQKAAFRRDVRATGATYPGDARLYLALREDLRSVNPVNLEELLAVVDEVEAAAQGEVDPDALKGLERITRIALAIGGDYAALEGDREFYLAVAPIVACRHFLLGWEGVKGQDGEPATFVRRGNLTTDDTLAQLDEQDLRAVGFKAMSLMRPSKDLEKNSASPSRSASSPRPSKTATKQLTAPSGNSSESDTSETPATA